MKKRIFPLIIALSALAVSGSAAFYSVFGLSKLFAGASLQVIIMAGSLEFAKLVVASLLYQYWDEINKALRLYLSIACFVLILITSGGIYGFLSGAYQTTATKSELLDKSLAILNQKQIRFEEQKTDLNLEKTQLNQTISDLRKSLSNPTSVSYYDKEAEQVITTTSSSTRRALQKELDNTINDRDGVNLKLEAILDSISSTDMALLDKEIDNEAERELGPLKYLSQITGKPMDQVVNWFLLLIIFVFDPLAIALVVAANFAFSKLGRKEEEVEDYFIHRNKHLEKIVEKKIEEPFEEEKWIPKPEEEDEDEKRMNIIGQNGNDGLHYDKIEPTKEDLDKLETHLNNLKTDTDELYYKEDYTGDLDRLTDTTQTLIVDKPEEKIDEKRTLKYRKRN
jgi:membrane protein implicated in regulation of membrane protease activity